MDNYIKIVSRLLIALMMILTIMYVIHVRVQSGDNLRKYTIEVNADGLAKQYIENIWNQNSESVDMVGKASIDDLYKDPKFISFAISSINLLKDLPVVKLNIYNLNHRKFLSSNKIDVYNLDDLSSVDKELATRFTTSGILSKMDSLFFPTPNISYALEQAFFGYNYSQIIPNAAFVDKDNITQGTLVHVVIPIKSSSNNTATAQSKVDGVIEFYYNISHEWSDIRTSQYITILGSLITFIMFSVILVVVSRRLEKMIEKQHEVNVELTEAKTKAEVESSEKSKFLANISHELRTPLNAIIGFSEIIKTEALGPIGVQQYKDYINDINNSGTHLLSLINDILDYSKAAAEKLQVDSIELDVTKILASSMRLVKPRAEEAKVNLIEEIPKGTLVVMADPKRLKQAVLNLLSNSVKFTPENGSVTLGAWVNKEEDTLIIQVKDTGIGIADKDISKAMASFGQVDSKLSRKYEGTGLGLPLTKKLVELMNGKFEIKSELGFGTTVSISFPYDRTKNQGS